MSSVKINFILKFNRMVLLKRFPETCMENAEFFSFVWKKYNFFLSLLFFFFIIKFYWKKSKKRIWKTPNLSKIVKIFIVKTYTKYLFFNRSLTLSNHLKGIFGFFKKVILDHFANYLKWAKFEFSENLTFKKRKI